MCRVLEKKLAHAGADQPRWLVPLHLHALLLPQRPPGESDRVQAEERLPARPAAHLERQRQNVAQQQHIYLSVYIYIYIYTHMYT